MECQKEIVKIIKSLGMKYSVAQAFSDFLEISACTVNNQFSGMFNAIQTDDEESVKYLSFAIHFKEREERYLNVINQYTKAEQEQLAEAFGLLVACINQYAEEGQPTDILGPIFHELELHNEYKGQFFTPQPIGDMMAEMTVGPYEQEIEKNGHISATDPTCGSGVMMLGFAKALNKAKYNYQRNCCITCIDIDVKCCYMAYIQLALYGIPGVVIHGNSLTTEEWERWYTPTYILDKWIWREKCGITIKFRPEDEALKCMEPSWLMWHAIQQLFPSEQTEELQPPTVQSIENDLQEIIEIQHPEQIALNISAEKIKASGMKHVRRQRKREKTADVGLEQLNLFD